jgi:hypothetical protein
MLLMMSSKGCLLREAKLRAFGSQIDRCNDAHQGNNRSITIIVTTK